ncbi:MAG: hypothetical protein WBC05_09470 [Sedimentisphaerales bacterium]
MVVTNLTTCLKISLLILAALCTAAAGKTIYVDDDAAGANDGTSWANAYNYLQDALADANDNDKPIEIFVANGTYMPDQGAGITPGDREATFQLINGATLKGCYAGLGESDPNARDVDLYKTILSGDLAGNDMPNFTNNSENSYHVVTGSGTNPTAIIDGFTVTGGNANGSEQNFAGGGMYNNSGSPTVTDCAFATNSADTGAGMSNDFSSNPNVTNCRFSGNSATSGGAMANSNKSSPTVTNCTFTGNRATNGGGIYCGTYDNTKLTNCTFSGNLAKKRGGAIYQELGFLTLANCILWGNMPMDFPSLSFASYSNVPPIGLLGEGSINTNPLFVNPGYWNPNETPDDPNDDFWIDGDYHLKSEAGQWDPNSQSWIKDDITSPCIDAGDPNSPIGDEPESSGGRINMGAYGGTPVASISTQDVNSVPNPYKAFNPNPANETFIHGHTLSWTAGLNAVLHDVYFGPNIPPELILNQTETKFDTGSLRHGVTYFWRIDEVDGQGNKTNGDLWRFNTIPPKGRACFTGETGVWADGALMLISTIGPGRDVGFIGGAGEKSLPACLPSLGKIEEVQKHKGTFVCYDVLLESGNCISVAENHYFMEESGRWIALHNLKAGTRLRTSKGSIKIIRVTKRPVPYVGKVYNLKVKGSDRYLVGEDAIIVRDY